MINFYKSHSKKAVTPVALKKTKHKIFFTFLLFFLLHNMCFGQIKVTLDNMGQNTCPGGSSGVINITVSGGTGTYVTTWNDNILTEDRNSLSQGTYFVTVTDGVNPAVVSPNFLITDPDPFTTTDITTAVSCFGESDGSSIITVTGGTPPYNSFKWYKSTNVIAGQ